MASPKIFYARLSDYTLSATSTNASYPLSNLQTYFAADQWRANNTNQTQQLAVDFGAARACNFIVIGNHNFNGLSDAAIALQGADDSGFSSGLVTAVNDLRNAADPYVATFGTQTKRYWRIYINGSVPTVAAPALGNLFLGSSLDFDATQEFPFRQAGGSFDTIASKNLQGAIVTAQEYGGRYTFDFQFKMFSDTFRIAFYSFFNTVRGKLRPFYYQSDAGTLYYVNLSSDTNPLQTIRYNLNDFSLQMQGQLAELT